MSLQLRDGLSFCVCAGRVILLDLKADRYFALGPSLEPLFRSWADQPAMAGGGGALAPLCERGILVPSTAPAGLAPFAAMPLAGDLSGDHFPTRRLVFGAVLAELAARLSLRMRPLASIVRRMERKTMRVAAGGPGRDLADAAAIAAAFARSALLLGASDRCLARALAAMAICRQRRIAASLVFGVRINPFAAHCWVQLGDCVLVGDFEQARLFTPILSVP